jgi:hypothetical protein
MTAPSACRGTSDFFGQKPETFLDKRLRHGYFLNEHMLIKTIEHPPGALWGKIHTRQDR